MNPTFWLIVFCIMLALEVSTLGLTTIWFAAGSLVTFFVSMFIDKPLIEWTIFLVGSIAALVALRPIFIDKFNNRRTKTNIDEVIGKTARVTEAINNYDGTGTVFMDGKEWTARSIREEQVIPEGQQVVVCEIRGVKLIVEPDRQSK